MKEFVAQPELIGQQLFSSAKVIHFIRIRKRLFVYACYICKLKSTKMEWEKNNFTVSTDKTKLNLSVIHNYLKTSYWAQDIPESVIKTSIENSLVFGLYDGETQIGFAKIITDKATFAYLADVFVINKYQGKGLGKWLVECVMSHDDLQGLRRILLATRDAHTLYEKYGFKPLLQPERFMQVWKPDVYKTKIN